MIRILAKLFAVTVLLITLSYVAPLSAAPVVYLSSTGSDANPCTATQPCADINRAMQVVDSGGQISCINSPSTLGNFLDSLAGLSVTIDCPGLYLVNSSNFTGMGFNASNQVIKIRNLTMNETPGTGNHAIQVTGSGTLIIENCVFENFNSNTPIDIEPIGPLNLVITNSRISNSSSGVFIKPAAGGSVTATFNGLTIDGNSGGGIKTDTTNGLVSVDISNSTISNNAGNGMNAVGGAGGTNMLNIKNSVIVRNGSAGVQANGANAAALIDTTLLDSNMTATSAINGGRVLTYGNNRIVGADGSGFTGTASLR